MIDFVKNQRNNEFLVQNFTLLSAEGKICLKNFLQNLVRLQNSAFFRPGTGGEGALLVPAAGCTAEDAERCPAGSVYREVL
jgi:hypothetical protein